MFAALRNLQTVWASDNELTGSIPEFIGNWSKLKSLILRNNNISGSIPSNIGDYQRLLQLNNKKEGIAWDNLCPCTLWNMGIKTRWHCFSSL
ncbi:unnamed protein product [Camellia sinensis]